jgi:hypothetical protein
MLNLAIFPSEQESKTLFLSPDFSRMTIAKIIIIFVILTLFPLFHPIFIGRG